MNLRKKNIERIICLIIAIIILVAVIILSKLYNDGTIGYAKPVESTEGKYLFCYFVGNEPEQESIHFAVSEDGYNFQPLNNNEAVITQTLGKKSVRDPYILRGNDGYFYIIGTDMRSEEGWKSNYALITWKSSDLVNWTDETIIDIRDFGGEFTNTTRAWAPQAIWDDKENAYMVYWANSTEEKDPAAIYYAYTTDFKTLTTPKLLYEREGLQTIDSDIIYDENLNEYFMYFKYDENQKIACVVSDELTGPYSDNAEIVSHYSGVEGSSVYKINGTNTYVMIADEYGKNRFIAEQSTDLLNFRKLKSSSYSMDFSPRHGSVVSITDEEYDNLINAFGL